MTVTVGGVPADAQHERRACAVRGVTPHRPPAPRSELHIATRQAIADHTVRRDDDRYVHMYELDGRWHVVVLDGWGRHIERVTAPSGGPSLAGAQPAANNTWRRLRHDAHTHPERWVLP